MVYSFKFKSSQIQKNNQEKNYKVWNLQYYFNKKNVHTIDGVTTKVTDSVKNDIIDALQNTLSLKQEGINLFFTDIDKMEEMIKNEINVPV